jgi:hypothetical protein
VEERAVIDRIEDERYAVLLVGDAEREYVLPLSDFPFSVRPGLWLKVQFDKDVLVSAVADESYTREVEERVRDKLRQLRKRGRRLDGEESP